MASLLDAFINRIKSLPQQVGAIPKLFNQPKIPLPPPVKNTFSNFKPTYQQATQVATQARSIPLPPPPQAQRIPVAPTNRVLDLGVRGNIASAQPIPSVKKGLFDTPLREKVVRNTEGFIKGFTSMPENRLLPPSSTGEKIGRVVSTYGEATLTNPYTAPAGVAFLGTSKLLKPFSRVGKLIPDIKALNKISEKIKPLAKEEGLFEPFIQPKGTKMRKFGKTIMETEGTAPEVIKGIKESPSSYYNPITNKATFAEADKIIGANLDNAITIAKDGPSTAVNNAISQKLIIKFQNEKNWTQTLDLVDRIVEKPTAQGQAIQILSAFKNLSPEGVLKYVQRKANIKNVGDTEKITSEAQKIKETVETFSKGEVKLGNTQKIKDAVTTAIDKVLKTEKASPTDLLAKKIVSYVKPAKKGKVDELVNELFKIAKDTLPVKGKITPKAALDRIKELFTRRTESFDVYQNAKEQVLKKFANKPDILEALRKYEQTKLKNPLHGSTLKKSIADQLKEQQTTLHKIIDQSIKKQNLTVEGLSADMVKQGFSKESAVIFAKEVVKELNLQLNSKKIEALNQMLKDFPKIAKKTILEKINKLSNLGGLESKDFLDLAKAKLKMPHLTEELASKIHNLSQEAQNLPEGQAKTAKTIELMTEIRDAVNPPGFGDWLDKVRYNSMLSSPTTHEVNIVSNLEGTGIIQPILKTIEGPIDAIVSGITRQPRTRFTGEGLAYAKGYASSVKQAVQKVFDVFKGRQISENPDFNFKNIPLTKTGTKSKIVENILDITTKALEAEDQFFKVLTTGALKSSYKYRLNKGGKDLSEKAAEEANKLLFRGELTEKGSGLISNTIGGFGKWVKHGRDSDIKAVRWMAKLTFPFINTGTNLAKAGTEGNILLGPLNYIGNEDKIAQTAKLILGSTVTLLAVPLALNGRLTFAEPTNPKQRDAFRAAKRLPYSININGTDYQYSKQHPLIAFQLATVAAVTQALEAKKIGENTATVVMQGLVNSLRFISDQTYFRNIGDFVNSLSGGGMEDFSRIPSNYASQTIPFRALMSWLNNMIDKYQRKPDTKADIFTKSFQNIASQLPYFSQFVPPRTGLDGKPVEKPDRFLNAFSPVRVSTNNPEGMDLLKQFQETSKLRSEYTQNSDQIDKMINELVKDPAKIDQMRQDGTLTPQLEKKIQDKIVQEMMPANIKDLVNSNNTVRSQYILNKIDKLTDPAGIDKFIKEMQDNKVLTPDVEDKLKELIRNKIQENNRVIPPESLVTPQKQSFFQQMNPVKTAYAKEDVTPSTPPSVAPIIIDAAKKNGVPSKILAAIAEHESNGTFDPNINEYSGGKGRGMFQIDLGQHPDVTEEQAKNIRFATDYAAKLLKEAFDRFGNWDDAIKAYNAGDPYSNRAGYNGQPVRVLANQYLQKIKAILGS